MTALADYQWLVSEAAGKWLALAAASDEPALRLATQLRKDLSPERARLVVEQAQLRGKASKKFSRADQMFFTALGLEQATDEWVADYKAGRFAANSNSIADLCCSIGGDLLGLAKRGPTTGVDRDPVAALLSAANLAACGGGAASKPPVCVADVGSFDVRAFSAWHLDPDRRPTGRRTTRVAAHDPPPETIECLLTACPNGAIKLAPAAVLPDRWAERAELEWISRRRECRQLVAWFGELAQRPGQRRATVLDPRGRPRRSLIGESDIPIPIAPQIGRYVLDPDSAVLAAGLTGALAAEHGLCALSSACAYLSGDEPLDDAALACFEVFEVLPLRVKVVKQWLAARSIGRLEIKKRGVEIDPNRLALQLASSGDNAVTLLIAPIRGRSTVIAAARV